MRETIGSTWVMQLMIGFIFLFVAFLAVTLSYSKAFKVRNEITSIIEKYGGYNSTSYKIINNYIRGLGYDSKGRCDAGSLGVSNLANAPLQINNNETYYYCVRKLNAKDNNISNIYYEITMFYKFRVPIVGDLTTFAIKGKTTDMPDFRGNDCFIRRTC